MKTLIIIPAYNEAVTIGEVLMAALAITPEVVVINDGSTDETASVVGRFPVTLIEHVINRGLGAAIMTGLEYAKFTDADLIVTLDADGQHRPADISRLSAPLLSDEADVVIGSRLIDAAGMPLKRRISNLLANHLTWTLFGLKVSDSQSGYRLLNRRALEKINLVTNRMEVSSEIIHEIRRHHLRLAELPIEAIYTDYSLSKGQSFTVGLKTGWKLILKRLMG